MERKKRTKTVSLSGRDCRNGGESMKTIREQYCEIYGIADEGEIVSKEELQNREEVLVCPEPLKSLWTTENN